SPLNEPSQNTSVKKFILALGCNLKESHRYLQYGMKLQVSTDRETEFIIRKPASVANSKSDD
ncbi:MAG: hypothetical protein P5700_27035, partial [Arthrospira platensis PCC 7345]|nr:hypothetical protein [Arthrospira platensis PCC 7345]